MPPSTTHPEALPDLSTLRRLTQALALLDTILCPEWEYRYYSYDARWDEDAQVAFMRNGSGDEWRVFFCPGGALLVGTSHEHFAGSEGDFAKHIHAVVPADLRQLLEPPNSAAAAEFATFCLWCSVDNHLWQTVAPSLGNRRSEDGSARLLAILDNDPSTYQAWAEDYYERDVALESVRAIYGCKPLDAAMVASLNPKAQWAGTMTEAMDFGYPVFRETPPVGSPSR